LNLILIQRNNLVINGEDIMTTNQDYTSDFIQKWIQTYKKKTNSEIICLIEKHLSGINMDELNEDNLLKDLISLAYKEAESDSYQAYNH
jgi:hypothetical protein